MTFKAVGQGARILSAVLFMAMAFIGSASADVICDPEAMPPRAAYADTLHLLDVDWDATLFYPEEGTWLDTLGGQYYSLESQFSFYGQIADFDILEEEPPHHFLPVGWRNLRMLTFRWNSPEGGTRARAAD